MWGIGWRRLSQGKAEKPMSWLKRKFSESAQVDFKPKSAYKGMDGRVHFVSSMLVAGGIGILLFHFSTDVTCMVYDYVTLAMRQLEPKKAISTLQFFAKHNLLPSDYGKEDVCLMATNSTFRFSNPIGLAAGYDVNAQNALAFIKLGFSHVEIGSIMLTEEDNDTQILSQNRSLLYSHPVEKRAPFEEVIENLKMLRQKQEEEMLARHGIIGVNLLSDASSPDKASQDFSLMAKRLWRHCDYLVLNLSSLSPDLLQDKEALRSLLQSVKTKSNPTIHWFVKIPLSVSEKDLESIVRNCLDLGYSGVNIGGSIKDKETDLLVSGDSLAKLSTQYVSKAYKISKGKMTIIASGGVLTAQDALEKIEEGADLVQLHSALYLNGVAAPRNLKTNLSALFVKKGYENIATAVGKAHKLRAKEAKMKKIAPQKPLFAKD